ncbi:hypothetical protein A3715_11285 [Oleiphilus sp. HI0009]|nr:hypothetical protein A3715_11285 [Oleiphilus sp. HI0009]
MTELEIIGLLRVIGYCSLMPMMCFYMLHKIAHARVFLLVLLVCLFASTLLSNGLEHAVLFTSAIVLSPLLVPVIAWPIAAATKRNIGKKHGEFELKTWPGLLAGYKIL